MHFENNKSNICYSFRMESICLIALNYAYVDIWPTEACREFKKLKKEVCCDDDFCKDGWTPKKCKKKKKQCKKGNFLRIA